MKSIFIILLIAAGSCCGVPGDYNGDGIVSLPDYPLAARGGWNVRVLIVLSNWLESDMGKYAQFTTDGKIVVAHDSIFDVNGHGFTVAFVSKTSAYSNYLSKTDPTTENGWLIARVGGAVYFRCKNAVLSAPVNANVPADGENHWIAFSCTAAGLCTPIVDGVAGTPIDISAIGSIDTTGQLIIGAYFTTALGYYSFLNAPMDDLRIYDVALTEDQAKKICNDMRGITGTGESYGLPVPTYRMDFDTVDGDLIRGIKANGFELNGTKSGGVELIEGGVPFDTDPSIISMIENSLVQTLAALQYDSTNVFKTSLRWKHQITPGEGGGLDSFARYSPFAFVKYQPADPGREGDDDLRQVLRFAIAIGKESKESGAARIGSSSELGIDKIRDLVIDAVDSTHPGAGIPCDDLHYVGESESVDTPKQYALEMYFEANYMTI